LKVNGEAIYGTRTAGRQAQWSDGKRPDQKYGEFMVKYNLMDQIGQQAKNGMAVKQAFFTKTPDALYAITVGWPGKQLVLRDLKVSANAKVEMLGVPGVLKASVKKDVLTITTPDLGPDQAPCQHAFVFKITGADALPEQ
jgi:alpha-L-fucosidase